jgi:F-box and WD-40 domain protein 1/11
MSSDPDTHWNLDEYQERQLPHPDHPEDGHTDAVYGVHLQDDHLVSVSADHTARVWDLKTQRLLYPPLVGHTGSVTAVQFDAAAHANVVITGDTVGNLIIWRFSTGEAIKKITKAHNGTVLSLRFDERYVVTGGKDGKIKLWNRQPLDVNHIDIPTFAARPTESDRYQEYSLLSTFDGHSAAVNAVRLKNNVLVSGSGDRTMCIWSLQTGKMIHKVDIYQRGIACLQYNGRFIVSGSTDESVRIYDIDQEMEIACLKGHTDLVRSVQAVFDNNGNVKTIFSGSYDGSIRVWEQAPSSKDWRTLRQLHLNGFQASGDGHPDEDAGRFSNRIFSVDLDANRFVCSGQGPVIRVWDLRLSSK